LDANREPDRKRKRSQEDHDPWLQSRYEPAGKRARASSSGGTTKNKAAVDIDYDKDHSIKRDEHHSIKRDEHHPIEREDNPVEYWVDQIPWPEFSFDKGFKMSQTQLARKRSSSGMSYTRSVKEGLNPPQYTPGYEKVLQDANIYMDEELGPTISNTSQELCDVLLNSFFPPPSNSLFTGQSFLLTLNEARNENEPRVQRDILPLLVPCASLLYLHDRIIQCRYLSVKIQAGWTKITPLAGPLPIPDYVVGLKPSAFRRNEILQLQTYSAPNKATLFRDGLYFPFLICEVSIGSLYYIIQTYDFLKIKCGEQGLSIAERQTMHVASVAANAIVQLFRDRAVSRAEELNREILVFSISHDYAKVKVHGHYARIEEDKITLHRHLIRSFDLLDRNGKERWTTYHIVRKIYDYFAPIHLERIRSAVAQLSVGSSFGLSSVSLASNPGVDTEPESDSQETAEDDSSPQGEEAFKKPRLKPTAMLQQEIDWLRKEREESNRQKQEAEERLERQRQEMNSQLNAVITQLQTSNANAGNDSEVVTMLRQQNAELKEQLGRQTQEISKLTDAVLRR
jgi:hypothetical protein